MFITHQTQSLVKSQAHTTKATSYMSCQEARALTHGVLMKWSNPLHALGDKKKTWIYIKGVS